MAKRKTHRKSQWPISLSHGRNGVVVRQANGTGETTGVVELTLRQVQQIVKWLDQPASEKRKAVPRG